MLSENATRTSIADECAETRGSFGLSPRVCALILFLLSAVVYLGNAFRPALLDDADASHAVVAREMLQGHDYVVLHMNGIRYLDKAPIHYWMVAGAYTLLGENAFATRLPVALAMIGLVLMVFEFGRRFLSVRAGFYGGLMTCTSFGFFLFTRIMIPEAIYGLEFTAIFYLFLRAWTGSLEPRTGYWGASALMGLAVLTRGLIGVVFPLGAIILFIVLTRQWRRWRELRLFSSALIFLAIAVPWHVVAELRAPGFFWKYFINEHFKRALGTRFPPDYDAVPLWLWWIAHLAWLFPWSVFVAFAIREIPVLRAWGRRLQVSAQASLLLASWVAVVLVFFSVLGGSRMEYYSFGAWPAMALLLGLGLARAEETRSVWLPRMQGLLAALGMFVAGALGYLVYQSFGIRATGDISDFLKERPTSAYRLSLGHLFDLTPQAFADLRFPALAAALVIVASTVGAYILRKRRSPVAANLVLAGGMAAFLFVANQAFGIFEPYMSSKPLADVVNRYLQPNDAVAIYGEFGAGSSLAFYTDRRVWIYNGRYNNLEYGSRYADAPKIFLTDADFHSFWNSGRRVFLFVPPEQRDEARKRLLTASAWLLAESGGKQIYTNVRVAASERPVNDATPAFSP